MTSALPSDTALPASRTSPRGPVAADALREAMGRFATGVTVVTTADARGEPYGTTANAVSSVSLDPPLVLACLRKESETLGALRARGRFAVNILHSSQRGLSDRFARRTVPGMWDAVDHRLRDGVPVLSGAIATLDCELHDIADGGDHAVVVGHVVELDTIEAERGEPLLFFAGGYRALGDLAPDPGTDPGTDEPVEVALPSRHGALRALSLAEDARGASLAILTGDPRGRSGTLVYAHPGCLLGDALGSTGCRSRARLHRALGRMRAEGTGVAVYHRSAEAAIGACCLTAGGDDEPIPGLGDEVLAALALAVRRLGLRDVRLIADPADAERARAAGVPVGRRLDPGR